MKRHHITLGATTTAKGVVITATSLMSVNDARMALEGDTIACPACKSVGKIVCVEPRQPESSEGKKVALDKDLCVCKCRIPPKLIANQTLRYQTVEPRAMERLHGLTHATPERMQADPNYQMVKESQERMAARPTPQPADEMRAGPEPGMWSQIWGNPGVQKAVNKTWLGQLVVKPLVSTAGNVSATVRDDRYDVAKLRHLNPVEERAGRADLFVNTATMLIPAARVGGALTGAEFMAERELILGRRTSLDGATGMFSAPKSIEYTPPGSMVLQPKELPWCGPATCNMVINDAKGHSVDLNQVVGQFKEVRKTGVDIYQMNTVLNKNGITGTATTNLSVEQLNFAVTNGQPVIVGVTAGQGNHFIIVDGIQTVEGASYYMTRDPFVGPRGVRSDLLSNAMQQNGNAIILEK
jgi:uncharacterized Zn-binding protein involved in type VI secretion